MIDVVVHRRDLRETLIRVIGLLTNTKPRSDLLPTPDVLEEHAPGSIRTRGAKFPYSRFWLF